MSERQSLGARLFTWLLFRLAAKDDEGDSGPGGPPDHDVDIVEWGPNAPVRIRIVPDRYHVPHAGTSADGRRFFLSDELFAGDRQFVAVFL